MADRIQIRRDTEANWTSADPILAQGEIAITLDDLDTDPKFKIGDGTNLWSVLPYFSAGEIPEHNYLEGLNVDDYMHLTAAEYALLHTHDNKADLDNYDPDNFAASNHNHNLADLTEKSYNSLTDKPTIPDGLPEGTDGQTLRNDSGTWEANSVMRIKDESTYKQVIINGSGTNALAALEVTHNTNYGNASYAGLFQNTNSIGTGTNIGVAALTYMSAGSNHIAFYGLVSTGGYIIKGGTGSISFSVDYLGKILSNYLAGTGNRLLYADESGNIEAGTGLEGDLHTHTNKDVLDDIIKTGDGDEFLADDGTYKAISGLPTGTENQTLRHNGTGWVANSFLYHSGDQITIFGDKNAPAFQIVNDNTGSSTTSLYLQLKSTAHSDSLFLHCRQSTVPKFYIKVNGTIYSASLTASKLVATNSSKELVSADLIAFSGGSVVKMLTADATRESNTTLAAVSDFTQALLASSKYRIVAKLTVHQAGGDADFKMQLTAPSGSSITGCYKIWNDGVNTQVTNNLYNDLTAVKNIEMDAYSDTAGYYYIEIEGIIETSTTAGNLTFSFAQLNSSAEITTLKKYSIIELTKI